MSLLLRVANEVSASLQEEAGERFLVVVVSWFKLCTEALSTLAIGIGVARTVWSITLGMMGRSDKTFNEVRLLLARHLTIALEFQLAADILLTSVAPSWEQIGRLAAIAAIRTALNYFLGRELSESQTLAARSGEAQAMPEPSHAAAD